MEDNLLILVNKPSLEHMAVMDNVNKPDLLSDDELMHYGILGMHWGVRRFQDKSGRLTSLGKAHLATLRAKDPKKAKRFEIAALENAEVIKKHNEKKRKKSLKKAQKVLKEKEYKESEQYKKKVARKESAKRKREEEIQKKLQAAKRKYSALERKKKAYADKGPDAVAKHIDLYSKEELEKLNYRYNWENRMREQNSNKRQHQLDSFNRALRVADNFNNVIKIVNSPIGKTVRNFIGGDATKNLFFYDPKYYGSGKNKNKNNNKNDRNKNKNKNKHNNGGGK